MKERTFIEKGDIYFKYGDGYKNIANSIIKRIKDSGVEDKIKKELDKYNSMTLAFAMSEDVDWQKIALRNILKIILEN